MHEDELETISSFISTDGYELEVNYNNEKKEIIDIITNVKQ